MACKTPMQTVEVDPRTLIDVSATRTNPRDNYISTRDTIQLMRRLVYESINHPSVMSVAGKIAATLKARTLDEDVARACYWWTKNHIRLKEDEDTLWDVYGIDPGAEGKELLLSPAYVLSLPSGEAVGDCDDFSTTLATLMIRLGINHHHVFFCTVAADSRQPLAYSHVYVTLKLLQDGRAFPLDCSHGPYPGWEVDTGVTKKAYWSI